MKSAKQKGESAVTPLVFASPPENKGCKLRHLLGWSQKPPLRAPWLDWNQTNRRWHSYCSSLASRLCLPSPTTPLLQVPNAACQLSTPCLPKKVPGGDYAALLRFSQNSLRSYRRRFKKTKRTKTFCFVEKGERKRIKCFSPSLWSSYSVQFPNSLRSSHPIAVCPLLPQSPKSLVFRWVDSTPTLTHR